MDLCGSRRAAVGLCGAVLLLTGVTPGAEGREPEKLGLDVSLVVASELSANASRALVAEAGRIWSQAGVEVRWLSAPSGAELPDAPLRVLVVARKPASDKHHNWVVGELLPLTGGRALAIASITSAKRVVEEARRALPADFPISEDGLAGIVLGRAVAHEIGHFILDSRTHAQRGLMRATFDAYEFADPRADMVFGLDQAARQWLKRTAQSPGFVSVPPVGRLALPPFSSFVSSSFSYER